MPTQSPPTNRPRETASFAETALTLGGKSADEARRTGAIDTADDQVEALFAPEYQTVNSPVHRAVWDRGVPVDLFTSATPQTPPEVQRVMDDSIAVVQRHKQAGTLLNDEGKITENVLADLGSAGYWGLLVADEYGGAGAPFSSFAPFLTRMALIEPTVAGLASVHGCIGAVDPVRTFGNAEQKQRFLPGLADGSRLSAFALTEPCAGSDLTALRTTARLEGDHYVVNGEKLFITNVVPGRTIGLVCLIDPVGPPSRGGHEGPNSVPLGSRHLQAGEPAVLIVELPRQENENFQLRKYGLWALRRTYNRGIIFRDFRVPAENLLTPPRGDGLTIAYHGLNLGRVSLCANAAGTMRLMMANMIPWAKFRRTYGAPIITRELVERRLGELAGLVVACDALVAWCAGLIDRGYRGEMECIVAKIFGSEAQKHAAIEYYMKTHGGRSFLVGHNFGDNIHEYLAPCIYEGEGEMLGMGFFKSLVKHHGKTYFEPIGKALAAAGIRQPNPFNPAHAWALKNVALPYMKWMMARRLRPVAAAELPNMPKALREHAEYACDRIQRMALEISSTMSRFQLKLADRQCRMAELSQRCQDLITMLTTSMYGARQADTLVQDAADIMCQNLRQKLLGRRPSNHYFRRVTELGAAIADGQFRSIAGVEADAILMPYEQQPA
ncbi:MAG: acyl-CoA dehydrogenase family protein [Planctomycetes bacterium]|nr:acyl-CoA dehydrogenase family protein [Planctomycetota bacterium]